MKIENNYLRMNNVFIHFSNLIIDINLFFKMKHNL